MQWKIRIGESAFTAESTEMLKLWYSEGRIPRDGYVYHPVLERWMYAKALEELRSVATGAASQVPRTTIAPDDEPEFALMKDMTDAQRLVFQSQLTASRKSPTTAVLLTLLLGGVGAHHFYFGKIGLGVLYLLFFWTFIPAIIALVETFFAADRARQFNAARAAAIAAQVRAYAG